MADHRVAEGIPLAIELSRKWTFHGNGWVQLFLRGQIMRYGSAAESTLPYWQALLDKNEKSKYRNAKLSEELRAVIAAIEEDKDPQGVISLGECMTAEQRAYIAAIRMAPASP